MPLRRIAPVDEEAPDELPPPPPPFGEEPAVMIPLPMVPYDPPAILNSFNDDDTQSDAVDVALLLLVLWLAWEAGECCD